MAYTAAHGLPTIDATWAWVPSTGPTPPTINDQGAGAALTPPLPTLPWIKLLRAPGFRKAPDAEDNRAPRTLTEGEIPYPGKVLGKTGVLVCEARALTLETLADMVNGCMQGYATNMTDEGTMTVTPYAFIGGVVWTFTGRVIDFEADETWAYFRKRRAPFRWGFTISIRQSDPNYYTSAVGYR